MNASASRQMANNTAKNSKPAQTDADIEKALAKRLQNTIQGNRFLIGWLTIDANNKVQCQYNPSDHSFTITLRDMTFPFSLNNYNQSVQTMARSMHNFIRVFYMGTDIRTNASLAPLQTNLNVQKAGAKTNTKPVQITPKAK